jgi:hypothetical protein
MNIPSLTTRVLAATLLVSSALASAATLTGTVTNKTTGKPAADDTVVLVDVAAAMGEVAKATTDANGRYKLTEPGTSSYLVRVTHQGVGYYIGAPQNGKPGDITVYNVATKVPGVTIDTDVIEVETDGSQLHVNERIFVHNTAKPPVTQWSKKSFEIVLPEDATITEAGAQRPGGLPTNIQPNSDGAKGHYSYDFPIQPDDGDKDTLFQVGYTVPYTAGKYTFHSVLKLAADNFAVLLPKSMSFSAGADAAFKPVQADPGVLTYLLKSPAADKPIEYTVSGSGSLPHEDQNGQGDQGAASQPGGGIGEPNRTPDPLSKYKWWILGTLVVLMAAGAAFLLRKPAGAATTPAAPPAPDTTSVPTPTAPKSESGLRDALKEELFNLESEKLSGTISEQEYAENKAALEVVIKRSLKKQ